MAGVLTLKIGEALGPSRPRSVPPPEGNTPSSGYPWPIAWSRLPECTACSRAYPPHPRRECRWSYPRCRPVSPTSAAGPWPANTASPLSPVPAARFAVPLARLWPHAAAPAPPPVRPDGSRLGLQLGLSHRIQGIALGLPTHHKPGPVIFAMVTLAAPG